MNKVGAWTERVKLYENIAKANGVEMTQEVINTICDYINFEEQKKEQKDKTRIVELLREKSIFKQYVKENYGSFYFSYYNELINKLKPQYLTRLLYLCSYMNYNNLLVEGQTHQKPIKESDLVRIWNISRAEMFNTKKELINLDILIVNEDKTLSINKRFCKRGEIMKSKKEDKVRIFNNAIRDIYENSKASEHKKIALLYKMLPYINLKWNILCVNPEEEIKDLIKPIEIKTLASMFNYNHVGRFKKELLSIKINGKPAVMVISALNKSAILVNPSIYYKGTRLEDVEYIEDMIGQVCTAM